MQAAPDTSRAAGLKTEIWTLFAAALAIRWAYALAIFLTMGDAGLKGPDSHSQLANAQAFASALMQGSVQGWAWLGPSLITMPLFNWLIGLHALALGDHAALGFVLTQGVIDAGTCLLVSALAGAVHRDYARPAGWIAAFNPTQIVVSGLVYTDTAFVFCVALFLLASLRWLETGRLCWALVLGCALGAALLFRMVAGPFAPALLALLFLLSLWRAGFRASRLLHLATAGAIALSCLAPVLARNVAQSGAWTLTPQGGIHLALWVAPLVKEIGDGTPFTVGQEVYEKRTRDRFGPPSADLYEEARRYTEIGREAMRELGPAAIAKAWLVGAAMNLASPAILLSPPVSTLPRTGFYATQGGSFGEKVLNFILRSESAPYVWALLLGAAGVAAIRVVQAIGFFAVARIPGDRSALLIMLAWIGYILVVNGPVATPKYRLPIEPALMVLAGAGWMQLRSWWRARRATRQETERPAAA